MACPEVAVEGDGLQLWGIAANTLNKQLQTADRGWSPAWKLDMGLATPHHIK
jgi:hypothetical protein